MSNLYCPSCGAKNFYNLKKPNFCSTCGSSFDSKTLKNTAPLENKIDAEELDPDETDVFEVPDLKSNLDVEINYEGTAKIHNPSDWFQPTENLEKPSGKKKKTNIRRKRR